MAPVTMPPTTEAREVFRRLGYTVTDDGPEFVAERKWRRVLVTPLCAEDATEPEHALADGGRSETRYRCFVTWKRAAADLAESLPSGLDYDWAVVGVDGDGGYEVVSPEGASIS